MAKGLTHEELAALVPPCLVGDGSSPLDSEDTLRRTSELLLDTERQIRDVASDVGYSGGSALAGAWRRIVGYSPTEWRDLPANRRERVLRKVAAERAR